MEGDISGGSRWGAAHAPSLKTCPPLALCDVCWRVWGSQGNLSSTEPISFPHDARQAGWSVGGLSACLFLLLLLSKFQEQAREAPVAESGRQDPDGARDTHTRARLGTDTRMLTHSHTLGLVPTHRPPCGDTQTPSTNSANPQNTPWTHREIQALTPTSHSPINRVGSRQQPEGGEGNEGGKDSRQQRGCTAKVLGAGVSIATLPSQNPVS